MSASGINYTKKIPGRTILFFRADLYHAGPSNLTDKERYVLFMDSFRIEEGQISDKQVHPMQVALYQFATDKNADNFYHHLYECEQIYGLNNVPSLSKHLIIWKEIDNKIMSLKGYNAYVKTLNSSTTLKY